MPGNHAGDNERMVKNLEANKDMNCGGKKSRSKVEKMQEGRP
jgi:hypothetical protein